MKYCKYIERRSKNPPDYWVHIYNSDHHNSEVLPYERAINLITHGVSIKGFTEGCVSTIRSDRLDRYKIEKVTDNITIISSEFESTIINIDEKIVKTYPDEVTVERVYKDGTIILKRTLNNGFYSYPYIDKDGNLVSGMNPCPIAYSDSDTEEESENVIKLYKLILKTYVMCVKKAMQKNELQYSSGSRWATGMFDAVKSTYFEDYNKLVAQIGMDLTIKKRADVLYLGYLTPESEFGRKFNIVALREIQDPDILEFRTDK